MSRMSVATIDSPEFINITSISPLVSKCEIKVLYVGENRNRSFITKEVATEMAQTLPGCPIVGYYIDKKEDFGDHGEQIIIDAEGVKFNKLTKPYGFVAPDTKIWFQKFNDIDEFGNQVVRDYLMTEGYLWTGQFPECQMAITEGRPQSMEIDEKTLKGHWSTNNNYGVEFFIINDGMFSKLCILGEDVEPCFEGAKISAPEVSATFNKNDNFVASLYSMMKDLKELTFSLQENKGGTSMADIQEVKEPVAENIAPEENKVEETKDFSAEQDKNVSDAKEENQNNIEQTEFKKNDDEEEKKEDNAGDGQEKEDNNDNKEENDDEDKKKPQANHSLESEFALIKEELDQLKQDYAKLEEQNVALTNFKNGVETEKKQDLINSFYMLSDEDKKDVVENMSKYTLDEIEAKLSVIGRRKGVNFSMEEEKQEENKQPIPVTYNLDDNADCGLPAWLKAVEARREKEESN